MPNAYSMTGVAICLPTSGRPVHMRWATSLPALLAPVGMSVGWIIKEGKDRAMNREMLVQTAIEIGARYVLFLDDDTVPPAFTIRYLHTQIEQNPKIMICGGIYCTKEDIPEPLVFKKIGGGSYYDWKIGDVFDCEGLGTGCMMIKTEVFQYIPRPWFLEPSEIAIDPAPGEPVIRQGTDDLYFCQKVIDAGFRIVAHGGVLPVHMDLDGKMYTLPLDSYPCQGMGLKEYKPNTVLE